MGSVQSKKKEFHILLKVVLNPEEINKRTLLLSTKWTLSHHCRKFCRGLSSESSATCQHMEEDCFQNLVLL